MKFPVTTKQIETGRGTLSVEVFNSQADSEIPYRIFDENCYPFPDISKLVGKGPIVDLGANVGIATIFFALQCPEAKAYAVEPGNDAWHLLCRNTARFPNIERWKCAVVPAEQVANGKGKLCLANYANAANAVYSSDTLYDYTGLEDIDLIGMDRIAALKPLVLKMDVEGVELGLLKEIPDPASIPVYYIEYHFRAYRKGIDNILHASHILIHAKAVNGGVQGEAAYVRDDWWAATGDKEKMAELLANASRS
jgi:FkbM family methyltransferase